MQDVSSETGFRLLDAATLLLDAAREAAKESPSYQVGKPNELPALALATQALFLADFGAAHYGKDLPVDPLRALDRLRGIAAGLGASVGGTPNAAISIVLLEACTATMRENAVKRIVDRPRGSAEPPR